MDKLLLISHENTSWNISSNDICYTPLNKWYEVESVALSSEGQVISIKTHYGSIGWIPRKNFLSQEEWRNKQLNELLQ